MVCMWKHWHNTLRKRTCKVNIIPHLNFSNDSVVHNTLWHISWHTYHWQQPLWLWSNLSLMCRLILSFITLNDIIGFVVSFFRSIGGTVGCHQRQLATLFCSKWSVCLVGREFNYHLAISAQICVLSCRKIKFNARWTDKTDGRTDASNNNTPSAWKVKG